jgi:DNA-binding NarL/FixJ family response regulator
MSTNASLRTNSGMSQAAQSRRSVLVVDDHDIVATGLRSALQSSATWANCRVINAPSIHEALQALTPLPDLILLDLHLPDVGVDEPFRGLSLLRTHAPQVPTAIFTANESTALIRDALREGAAGFIPKRTDGRSIAAIIDFVLKGGIYIPPHLVSLLGEVPTSPACAEQPRRAHRSTADSAETSLTPRQRSVLSLVLQGLSNKEIARALGLTVGTTKNYVSELLKASNVRTRSEMLATLPGPRRLRPLSPEFASALDEDGSRMN